MIGACSNINDDETEVDSSVQSSGWACNEATKDVLQRKLLNFVYELKCNEEAFELVGTSKFFQEFSEGYKARLSLATNTCKNDARCYLDKISLSSDDIAKVDVELRRLAEQNPAFELFLTRSFREKGFFPQFSQLPPEDYVGAVWSESVESAAYILDAYGLGQGLRYPKIDSGFYGPDDERLGLMLRHATEHVLDDRQEKKLFFESWSRLVLDLLIIQQRQEAANFEPLSLGENAAALMRSKTTDWSSYPYAAIVTLGAGNREQESGLATLAAFRSRLAARRYFDGLAPFIIVSGGNVHPARTLDNESYLMKQDLMVTHGVAENAIIIEPFARHTTTNLRNASRRLLELGAPTDKALLLTTSKSQSQYIESKRFQTRCENELGYQPVFIENRLSDFDLTMKINPMSHQLDPMDPLDP